MEYSKDENKTICKFLDNVANEGGKDLIKLSQFIIMKWSQEAIDLNAGELILSQTLNHNGEKYRTRMAIQYSKIGEKTLDERAYELADRMLSTGLKDCDIWEELKKAILAGYNLHHEDFVDE